MITLHILVKLVPSDVPRMELWLEGAVLEFFGFSLLSLFLDFGVSFFEPCLAVVEHMEIGFNFLPTLIVSSCYLLIPLDFLQDLERFLDRLQHLGLSVILLLVFRYFKPLLRAMFSAQRFEGIRSV